MPADAASAMPKFVPVRRKRFSPFASVPLLALFYGAALPAVKLLEIFGKWPAILARRRGKARIGGFAGYRPTAHDVFACSYFKSGTYWLMQMTVEIAHRGCAEYGHIHDIVPWPDGPDFAPAYAIPVTDESPWRNSPTGLRVIKTHLPAIKVPYSEEARYVAVVRDPKSAVVSGYHFTKSLLFGPAMPSVGRWVELFLSPNFPIGNWAEHLAGWWALRPKPNVLFMTYEEMVADPRATVRRAAEFMGVALSDGEFARVVERSSFAHMKAITHKFDFIKTFPWSKPEGANVRRGGRGGADELLTPALQKRIDDECRAQLRALGCDFPYDEAFGAR